MVDEVSSVTEGVIETAREVADSRPAAWSARWGLAARGAVWLLMGVLALLVAAGERAEVDQKGALHAVVERPLGGLVVLVLALGFSGYALWRFSEAAFGSNAEGRSARTRATAFVRGIAYVLLAVTAISVLLGSSTSQARQQATLSSTVMAAPGGRLLVLLAGLALMVVGAVLVVEGVSRKFLTYLDHAEIGPRMRVLVRTTGTVGTCARGLVFALVGGFVVAAAWTYDTSKASGIDVALKSLRGLPLGDLVLLLVALGLIVFGLYGLLEARYRRV